MIFKDLDLFDVALGDLKVYGVEVIGHIPIGINKDNVHHIVVLKRGEETFCFPITLPHEREAMSLEDNEVYLVDVSEFIQKVKHKGTIRDIQDGLKKGMLH